MLSKVNEDGRAWNERLLAWLQAHRSSFWLGWPALVILSWLAVLAFAHFRPGWGLYWAWGLRDAPPAVALLFGPGLHGSVDPDRAPFSLNVQWSDGS